MVARYKNSFKQLTAMLHIIRSYDNLPPRAIVDFQLLILKKVKRAEKSIIQLKEKIKELRFEKANDRPNKERSNEITILIEEFNSRIEGYRYAIYIWKMYVDSIAFHYCDKYAIKQFLYDENYKVKETSGFISGKKGLRNEIKLLNAAAENNVPAVLCDLTNTLRHGDVCLLGQNDPYPIEVKTSSRINKRGEKQLKKIDELNKFLISDKAENFRGNGPVIRLEHTGKEKYHLRAINDCICKCYKEGTSHVSPEKGIHYIAITKPNREVFEKISAKYVHMINLNDFKDEMSWHPYTPFLLTLNPEHIYNFIDGSLNIFVLLDLQAIKRRFNRNGLHVIFLQDEHWYAQISATGNILDGGFRVSTQSFLRIAFEFQSLTWAIKQHKRHLNAFVNGSIKLGKEMEIPPDWISASDFIPM
ncbi:MAG: hypothetical protein G3W58_11350 [Pantoea ananatis]|nr:hypothetical protein [Pantoea ananatis]